MKHIKFLGLCFLALGIVSCDDDEAVIETEDVGGNVYLADRSITLFDQNADLTINLMTDGEVTFESVEIEDADGNLLTTATISGETATFNTSSLGDFAFGDDLDEETGSFPIRIVSVLSNGKVLSTPFTINVGHALTLGELDQVIYLDPTTNEEDEDVETELEYSVSTFAANVDDLTLEWKVGSEGTYVAEEDIELSTSGGVIDFSTLHYLDYGVEIGDTLYYRFTATSGSLQDQAETTIVIAPQAYGDVYETTLSNDETASQLDLSTGELSATGSATGDIAFTSPTGFEVIGDSDMQFVEVTGDDFSTSTGLTGAREAFEAGTPSTSFTNVENGDVFVYRVTRDGDVYYGYFTVGTVTVVDGTAVGFDVESAEGSIVE